MDVRQIIKKHAQTTFQPAGIDDTGAFMIVEQCRLHVRSDDLMLVEGMPLEEIWPLIDDFQDI